MKAVTIARVKEINRLYGKTEEALRTTLQMAIRLGELLCAQKADLRHGEWLPWLEANTPIPPRSAANYMRVYENRALLKKELISNLPEARRLLTVSKGPKIAPPVKESARDPEPVRVIPVEHVPPAHPIRHGLAAFLRRLAETIEAGS
jgi:hypothetical protein